MQTIKILLIVLASVLSFRVNAAGPMMHVVLGEHWLASNAPNYTEDQKKLFLLGTVFPDIRYLGVIKREKTHFAHVTLKQIKATQSPFQRGVLFHSYVDEYRKKLVEKSGIEKKLIDISPALKGTFLKLIEDQIVSNTANWSAFRGYLSTIPIDEKNYGIDEHALMQWHTGLTIYFTVSPMMVLTQLSIFEKSVLHIDVPTIQSWNVLLPKYVSDKRMQDYVTNLIKAFDEALQ